MIYFLIPVYNEEANIPQLAANLIGLTNKPCFYVFSDDGSSDDSGSVIKKHFASQQHVVLGDGKNYGPGHAFNTGLEWILNHSFNDTDKVVTLEADNTSDLSVLPIMLTLAELRYDLVLASPYAQGGGFSQTSIVRKVLSFFANMIFRLLFDIKVLTLSSFYRIYSMTLLKSVKERFGSIIEEYGFLCMLEILVKAIKVKAQIIEVPMVLHSNKRVGRSKMKLFKTSWEYVRFLLFKK